MVTRQTRIEQVTSLQRTLASAIKRAKLAEANESLSEADREAAWREVADFAGQIQRRGRRLGGLSRGG